ncbi:MAG: hypothetical protein M2R45_01908 [Verrucomicrobia subdivision 3 bacterium]|nr:hypothetical protein [Limisphaerales bacterium]MCS1415706.1 hypothetical protein [Limisphaerales bacterium]
MSSINRANFLKTELKTIRFWLIIILICENILLMSHTIVPIDVTIRAIVISYPNTVSERYYQYHYRQSGEVFSNRTGLGKSSFGCCKRVTSERDTKEIGRRLAANFLQT